MTDPSATSTDPRTWVGHPVTGAAGEPLGRVATVFTDPTSGAATWAVVDAGGGATPLVPLDGVRADGPGIRVPYDAEQLRTAPPHDPAAALSHEEAAQLARHYAARPPRVAQPGGDGSEPGWAVRHEERLRVLTDTFVTGRVRVRKYAVTEERTFTVQVTREEISIEHEEVPAGEHAPLRSAEPGAEVGEQVLELVRHEERVVVAKEVVPVERVRVVRHVVTRPHTVRGDVRREVVDVDEDRTAPDGPRRA